MTGSTAPESPAAAGAWAPFARRPFAVLWVATVVSNIGTWMNEVGAGWLMTELSPSPALVAGVQAATTLPVFLFALLAGAIADIVDRRRLLIVVNSLLALTALVLALVVAHGYMTPILLLLFTFLLGTGAAFVAPAWQAIVPRLVPRTELPSAIALNSMGINVSRAVGPALAGVLIVALGIWSPFALNAASFVIILAALWWWTPPAEGSRRLPPESVVGAMAGGLRYAYYSGPVRSTLVRAAAFFVFASAYWAMLPLIARQVLEGGPTLYGILLAAVGAGAVVGAIALPVVRRSFGPNWIVAGGTIGTALVLVVFALVRAPILAALASALAGMSWIAVLSSLHVSAQTSLPDWVRARGLSIFLTVFFGAMSLGSLVWGQVAALLGISGALLIAATGALLFIPLTWKARLDGAETLDLAPSAHWPQPMIQIDDPEDKGPVMIQIIYDIASADQPAFRRAMSELAAARARSGGYRWRLMQDAEAPEHFVEIWFEASWTAHLRHHERVSEEDKAIQDRVLAFQQGESLPVVRHFLAPKP